VAPEHLIPGTGCRISSVEDVHRKLVFEGSYKETAR
jgi:hypothetical protein